MGISVEQYRSQIGLFCAVNHKEDPLSYYTSLWFLQSYMLLIKDKKLNVIREKTTTHIHTSDTDTTSHVQNIDHTRMERSSLSYQEGWNNKEDLCIMDDWKYK